MCVKGVLKGAIFALLFTAAAILVLSVITYLGNIDGKISAMIIYAISAAGVALGAVIAVKKSGRAALLHAMSVSGIYLAVLVALSAALNRFIEPNGHFLTMTAGILIAGFLGAVLGKN